MEGSNLYGKDIMNMVNISAKSCPDNSLLKNQLSDQVTFVLVANLLCMCSCLFFFFLAVGPSVCTPSLPFFFPSPLLPFSFPSPLLPFSFTSTTLFLSSLPLLLKISRSPTLKLTLCFEIVSSDIKS